MPDIIFNTVKKIKAGGSLTRASAQKILALQENNFHTLLYAATEIRSCFKGNRVKTCSIINAKSGRCSEDCRFCAQSAHYRTRAKQYALMTEDEMLAGASKEEGHSLRYGIVTAGKGLAKKEIETVCRAVSGFKSRKMKQKPCASLGILDKEDFKVLKRAGLTRYHHNLEVCRSFYPQICSTHPYEDRVKTIKAAKQAGLEVCVGGIFGVGESLSQRLDLLYEIKQLDPDSVPLNFLTRIPGTPLEGMEQISLWEAIKLLALARFIMPGKEIVLGAGRLEVFKDAQHLVFLSGANGMIVGDLLTVKNRTVEDDLRVIRDMGLKIL